MGLFNLFYSNNSIQDKIYNIKNDMYNIILPICDEKFWVESYGAFEINPRNLVFWICVKSDKVKSELQLNQNIQTELRSLLEFYDYPELARDNVFIGFESQETVDRESKGNWYHHFK